MPDINLAFILKLAQIAGLSASEQLGDYTLRGTAEQWEHFGTRLHDERWVKMLHRRVTIEQYMLDAANGKRAAPTLEELREWALKLGGQGS